MARQLQITSNVLGVLIEQKAKIFEMASIALFGEDMGMKNWEVFKRHGAYDNIR